METLRRNKVDHPHTTLATLFWRQTAVWSAYGLLGGLYYRTLSHAQGRPGGQLAVVHTHALTLGALFGLAFLALATRMPERTGRLVFWLWNAGLAVSTVAMTVNGTLWTLGNPAAGSAPLAGVAGLGHMTMTAAFVVMLLAVRPRPVTVFAEA